MSNASAMPLTARCGGALRGTCAIPLTIHVVRRTNGTGGLEANWIAECIADASAVYAPIGVSFVQAGPTDFINNTAAALGARIADVIHAETQEVDERREDDAPNAPTFLAVGD